jgi:hypothetical protein
MLAQRPSYKTFCEHSLLRQLNLHQLPSICRISPSHYSVCSFSSLIATNLFPRFFQSHYPTFHLPILFHPPHYLVLDPKIISVPQPAPNTTQANLEDQSASMTPSINSDITILSLCSCPDVAFESASTPPGGCDYGAMETLTNQCRGIQVCESLPSLQLSANYLPPDLFQNDSVNRCSRWTQLRVATKRSCRT